MEKTCGFPIITRIVSLSIHLTATVSWIKEITILTRLKLWKALILFSSILWLSIDWGIFFEYLFQQRFFLNPIHLFGRTLNRNSTMINEQMPDLHFLMNLTIEYFYKATKPRKFEINSPGRVHFRFFVIFKLCMVSLLSFLGQIRQKNWIKFWKPIG